MSTSEVRVFDCEQGDVSGKSFAIIVSRYYKTLTPKLLQGALDTLDNAGVDKQLIAVAHVPGAWELSAAAARMIKDFDALICLGVVIKGETTHDQYLSLIHI